MSDLYWGCLAAVKPEAVSWLWQGRIPLGKLTVLDGDPGLGKSTLLLDIAARVTRGDSMPDGSPGVTGDVAIATAEDGLADTVRPRFDAAGGDAQRVITLEGVVGDEAEVRPLSLPDDVPVMCTRFAELRELRLVIVDPLMAYLGSYINTRIDHDVRRSLAPLAQLAETTGAAIVLVRHLNKASGSSALYRGGGSIGIIGAARAGLLLARDPEDDTRRVLAVTKMNLAPEPPSLGFTIDGTAGVPRIQWLGQTTHRANDLVTVPEDAEERQEGHDLKTFLREMLELAPRTQKEAIAACRAAGFDVTERTIRRARKAAGVTVHRRGFGPGSVVVWSVNGHSGHIPDIGDIPREMSGMSDMGPV